MKTGTNLAEVHYGNLACGQAIAICIRRALAKIYAEREKNGSLKPLHHARTEELYALADLCLQAAHMRGSQMLFCFEMPSESTPSGGWQAAHIALCALLDESIGYMGEEAQRAADAVKRGAALQPVERLQAADADTMYAAARQAQDIFRHLLEALENRRLREWAARNRVSGGGQPERTPARDAARQSAVDAYTRHLQDRPAVRDLGSA